MYKLLLSAIAGLILFQSIHAQPVQRHAIVYKNFVPINLLGTENQKNQFDQIIDSLGNLNPNLIYYHIEKLNQPRASQKIWNQLLDSIRLAYENKNNALFEAERKKVMDDTSLTMLIKPRLLFALSGLELNQVSSEYRSSVLGLPPKTNQNLQGFYSWLYVKNSPGIRYNPDVNWQDQYSAIQDSISQLVSEKFKHIWKNREHYTVNEILREMASSRFYLINSRELDSVNWYELLTDAKQNYLPIPGAGLPFWVSDYLLQPYISQAPETNNSVLGFRKQPDRDLLKIRFRAWMSAGVEWYPDETVLQINEKAKLTAITFPLKKLTQSFSPVSFSGGIKLSWKDDQRLFSWVKFKYSFRKESATQAFPSNLDTTIFVYPTFNYVDTINYKVTEGDFKLNYETYRVSFSFLLIGYSWFNLEGGWINGKETLTYKSKTTYIQTLRRFIITDQVQFGKTGVSNWELVLSKKQTRSFRSPLLTFNITTPYWLTADVTFTNEKPRYSASIEIPVWGWW